MKRFLTMMLALVLALSGVSFARAEGEPMEISVAFWDVETFLSGGENDRMLQFLQDKFNVKFVAQNTTWDDYKQKIQAWAASDTLPDIFAIDAICTSNYYEWINDGLVRALPADLSAYPNLQKYLDVDDIRVLAVDGQLYCIPRKTYPDNYWNAIDRVVLYRWDLAQAAGVTKEPETFDEFRDMLRKIIAADPEGKKVQGLTTTTTQLLDGFFFTYSLPAAMSDGSGADYKWTKTADGTWMPTYFVGDMLSTFQLARDMYVEGTVEKDVALAKLQVSYDKFLSGQSAALLVAGGIYSRLGKNWAEVNNGDQFWDDVRMLKLLPGKDSTNFSIFRTSWSESYISSKVSDEKLAKILEIYEYLVSEEGAALTNMGFEGEDYEVVDGKYVSKLTDTTVYDKYPSSGLGTLGSWTVVTWNDVFPAGEPDPTYREKNLERVAAAKATGELPSFDMRLTYMSTPLKDKFVIKPTDDLLAIMMGDKPVEEMVEDLMKTYNEKGLQEMVQEVNAKVAEMGF